MVMGHGYQVLGRGFLVVAHGLRLIINIIINISQALYRLLITFMYFTYLLLYYYNRYYCYVNNRCADFRVNVNHRSYNLS